MKNVRWLFCYPFFVGCSTPTFGHLELAKTKCKQMLASTLRKLKFEQKCLAFFFGGFPGSQDGQKSSLKIHQTTLREAR